jgi:hypothetical protein
MFKIEQTGRALAVSLHVQRAWAPMVLRMQDFIRQKNLENYRRLLAGKLGDAERVLILKLLAEEKAKDPPLRMGAKGDD